MFVASKKRNFVLHITRDTLTFPEGDSDLSEREMLNGHDILIADDTTWESLSN